MVVAAVCDGQRDNSTENVALLKERYLDLVHEHTPMHSFRAHRRERERERERRREREETCHFSEKELRVVMH